MNKFDRLKKVSSYGFKTSLYIGIDKDRYIETNVIQNLLEESKEHSLNIRTYKDNQDKGCPFVYGLKTVNEVINEAAKLQKEGYHLIINETIDENDGGVSGIIIGKTIGFAPFGTVRSVMESEDICVLPTKIAIDILYKVYQLTKEDYRELLDIQKLAEEGNKRIEISIHQTGQKIIVWDIENLVCNYVSPTIKLGNTNRFSEMLGEKVYNLTLINSLGIKIPSTEVINRYITKDKFRIDNNKGNIGEEIWTRTSPKVKTAGRYITSKGFLYAGDLINEEVPSVMYQEDRKVSWAGSAIYRNPSNMVIEGVEGYGDKFQIGEEPPQILPLYIRKIIKKFIIEIKTKVGKELYYEEQKFMIEWGVKDNKPVLFQINFIEDKGRGMIIVPNKTGDTIKYTTLNTELGLEDFRKLIEENKGIYEGVKLVGNIGITSHFCDILRESKIPSYLQKGEDFNG